MGLREIIIRTGCGDDDNDDVDGNGMGMESLLKIVLKCYRQYSGGQ